MGKEVKKHGYSCKLVRVVDGDTCDAMIDLGFNVWVKNRIRFMGVDGSLGSKHISITLNPTGNIECGLHQLGKNFSYKILTQKV